MGFKEGVCPKCHERIQVPEDRERILCMYCGQEIETAAAVSALKEEKEIAAKGMSCMDIYGEVEEDFLSMLSKLDDPMKGFKKQTYEGMFREYYRQNLYIIEAIEKAYCVAEDKDVFIRQISSDFVGRAKEALDAIGKKSKKEDRQIRNNMAMVVYIIPAIVEFKGASSQILSDTLVEIWNDTFDKTCIKTSSYDLIESGFKRRFCYITTAVCESLHKGDDCYELNLLRDYRDSYMLSREDGEAVIREYYNVAPTIVKHISRRPDSDEIYQGIYENYLKKCVHLIEENELEECRRIYSDMVEEMEKQFFFSEDSRRS